MLNSVPGDHAVDTCKVVLCIIMCQYKCRIRRKEVQSGLGLGEKRDIGLGRDSQDVHFVEEGDTSRL